MKRKAVKIFCLLLSLLFFTTVFSACGKNPPPNGDGGKPPQSLYLNVSLSKGILSIEEYDKVESYAIYVNGELLTETDKTNVDLAKNIISQNPYSFNDKWSVEVEGIDENGNAIVATEEAVEFSITALNTSNFVSVLSGNYDDNDYFILEENVNLYGIDEAISAGVTPPSGFSLSKLVFATGSIRNFINKPLTACVDGNGYEINILVDKRISFRADTVIGLGGLFDKVESNGEIKNAVINIDVLYEQVGGWYTGPLVYQGFYGSMKNCFVNTTLRPVVAYRDSNSYYNSPIVYETDERAGIFGVLQNASISDCIFKLNILDEENNRYGYGGVVGLMLSGNTVTNCAFIRDSANPTFLNESWDWALNNYKAVVENLSYYTSVSDFISGTNGKVFNGTYGKDSTFSDASQTVYANYSNAWTIKNNSIKLNGKLISIR